MKLRRVIRLDSTALNKAFFTEEGYLIDTPILTSTGIFEYGNPDGSIRRELRLPEEVFDQDSLSSYIGKPVIVTHDAGLVTKDNVRDNEIGTILSNGYRDGDNVRAKIVIHDTDEMKRSGLKELSLGYNLDLDETPGEWHGQHYDAIQRNIRINHLALVREARAGEQARLNIDGKDAKKKGADTMSRIRRKRNRKARRADSVLSPDELKKAIAEYKKRHPLPAKEDEDEPETDVVPVPAKAEDEDDTPIEEKVAEIKQAQENEDDDDATPDELLERKDEDIQSLLDIIDTLLAERDFGSENSDEDDTECEPENEDDDEDVNSEDTENEDDDEDLVEEENEDDDDDDIPFTESENEDDDEDPIPTTEDTDIKPGEVLNADSIDAIVRARVKIGIAAEKLHLDGIESMPINAARKAVIRTLRPSMNLDGKSPAYIKAAFDCAFDDIKRRTRKGTKYQKKQMFNRDAKSVFGNSGSSADAARRRMIERRQKRAK